MTFGAPDLFNRDAERIHFRTPGTPLTSSSQTMEQRHEGSLVVAGGHLVYAFTDKAEQIVIASARIDEVVSSRKLSALWNWSYVTPKSEFQRSTVAFKTSQQISVTAVGEYVYVFWTDTTEGQQVAYRIRPDLSDGVFTITRMAWHRSAIGQAVQPIAGPRAALALPASGNIALLNLGAGPSDTTLYGEFAPRNASYAVTTCLSVLDFMPFKSWQGRTDATLLSDTQDVATLCNNSISAVWFTNGASELADPATGAISAKPQFHIVMISAGAGSKNQRDRGRSFTWRVDEHGFPWLSSPRQVTPHIHKATELNGIFLNRSVSPAKGVGLSLGAALVRDPGRRIGAYFCDTAGNLQHSLLIVEQAPTPGNISGRWADPNFICRVDAGRDTIKSGNRPAVAFLGFPNERGDLPLVIPEHRDSNNQVLREERRIKNYEIQRQILLLVMRGGGDFLEMLTRNIGTNLYLSNFETFEPSPIGKQKTLLTLVADGFPFPSPNPTSWDISSPSGMVNRACCSYEYMVGDEGESESETEHVSMFGIRASYTGPFPYLLSAGIDATVSAGFLVSTSARKTVSSTSTYKIDTKNINTLGELEGLSDVKFSVSQHGAVFGRPLPSIIQDLSIFADEEGSQAYRVIADTNSLSLTLQASPQPDITGPVVPDEFALRVRPTDDAPLAAQFKIYTHDPNNLLSAFSDKINNKMCGRFSSLSDIEKRNFIIDGIDYRSCYDPPDASSGIGYIERIEERLGVRCFGPGRDKSYLDFAISASGMARSEFQDTSSFATAGGFLLDSSYYQGFRASIAVGVSVVAGGSYDVSAEVLFGWQSSTSVISRARSTNAWGIRLSEYLNPLVAGESYTARLYFFKPSPLWAAEVTQFGQDDEASRQYHWDAKSAPVRLLFTVASMSEALKTRLISLRP